MPESADPNQVEVTSDYVRSRHCVVLQGRFAPLWEDLDLHLLQNVPALAPEHRQILRDLVVACVLHHANRPRDEMTGWTLNLPDPPINAFATGDSESGVVAGRIFTRDVKETERGRLFAQINRPRLPMRESIVEVNGKDPFGWIESYYRQSEQRPARYFRLGEDRVAMLVAQHGYDEAWFETVNPDDVVRVPEREPLGALERRSYHFGCGCDVAVIRGLLRDASRGDLDDLFGTETELKIDCPRCASAFVVTREEMERFLAGGSS